MKTTNKFRNAFFIVGFCLLNTFSYGQTKEETISWLKEKLNHNLSFDPYVYEMSHAIDINECEIIVSFKSNSVGLNTYTYSIPTRNTCVKLDGEFFNDEQQIVGSSLTTVYKPKNVKSTDIFKIDEGEKDLRIRVDKAIKHLATFCTKEKKKETF